MKTYVASAFCNKPEVRSVQNAVRAAGHTITHDWTSEPQTDDREHLERCGEADFQGVLKAERLIVIAHPEMRDTRVEFGIALGRGIRTWVLYPDRAPSVFYGRVRKFHTLWDLIAAL